MNPVVLVVDDQPDLRLSAQLVLSNYGYDVKESESPEQAIEMLTHDASIELVLLDMNYTNDTTSGEEGLWFLRKLSELNITLPVIAMTAWASIDLAVKAMQLGAQDFVEKPWENKRLVQIVKQQLRMKGLLNENLRLRQQRQQNNNSEKQLIYQSDAMKSIFEKLARLAKSDATVLLTGENGTGKSAIAQFVHQHSLRSDESFVSVNMGAIPESLFESEMFGHIKGAFTDAKNDRIGRFEIAENGTLFLDEIANIPLTQQGKLLRVLEEGFFERVGASRSQKANVRLICATNADLPALIEEGKFRADLYFRLNILEVKIPTLLQRHDDIIPLASYFLTLHGEKYGRTELQLSESAKQYLCQYRWPGNVRELGHVIERAVLLADSNELSGNDIDLNTVPMTKSASKSKTDVDQLPLIPLIEAEQKLIIQALRYHLGNVQAASKTLGITDSALYRRMEKHQISKTYIND